MKSPEIQALESELGWIKKHKEDSDYSVDSVNGIKQAFWIIQQVQETFKEKVGFKSYRTHSYNNKPLDLQ